MPSHERRDYVEILMSRQETRSPAELADQLETAWKRRTGIHRALFEKHETETIAKDGDETGEYQVAITAELLDGIITSCRAREHDLIKAGRRDQASKLRKYWSAQISKIHKH